MKFWAIICLFFGFYNIKTLFEERYRVKFVKVQEEFSSTPEFDYLYCMPIEGLFERRKEKLAFRRRQWTLEQLRNASFESLRRRVNLKKGFLKLKKIISDADETNSYAFFYFRFCLLIQDVYELKNVQDHLPVRGSNCFMVSKKEPFIFLDFCVFVQFYSQLKVVNLPHPYSNCLDTIGGNRPYSKFRCTNECLRTANRSLLFYYEAGETGPVDTSHRIGLDLERERYCLEQCSRDNCELHVIGTLSSQTSSKIIQAVPLISELEFAFQLISLINLLTGLTVLKECYVLTGLFFSNYDLARNYRNFARLRKIYNYLKKFRREIEIAILLVCLLSTFCVYFEMVRAFGLRRENPLQKENINFAIATQSFSLVICSKLKGTQDDDRMFDSDAYNASSFSRGNSFTFKQLIEWSKNEPNRTLDSIYIDYGSRRQTVNWRLSPKVYFFFYENGLFKCFRVELSFTKKRIQNLIMISKLVVAFKHTFVILHLLPRDRIFTSSTYVFNGMMDIIKKREFKWNQYERGECIDYRQLDCLAKQNCIDKCISETFLKLHKSITIGVLIDKDHISNVNAHFNYTADFDIRKKCEETYAKDECFLSYFSSGTQMRSNDAEWMMVNKFLKVDLSIDSVSMIEESTDPWKLLFDLLNFQSIVFGLSVKKLFLVLYRLAIGRRVLRPKSFRVFKYIVYLFCLTGLVLHFRFIHLKIINGELEYSQYYQESKEFLMPELVFCVQFDESANDPNHKQTGHRLEELTKNFTIDRAFHKILYLNRFNQFETLTPSFNNSNPDVNFKTFLFLSRKCFRLSFAIPYVQQQFHFTEGDGTVRIFMNKQFLKEVKLVYFISKVKDTMFFSKLVVFAFNQKVNQRKTFQVRQRISEVWYNDRFAVLKNPISLFVESSALRDVTRYLVNLKRGFLKLGYETRQLPIADDNFNYEIDESLFDQFFSQVQNRSDNRVGSYNPNYKRDYISNEVSESVDEPDSVEDFEFVPMFFKEILEITNSDSYTSVILHCLNAVSIWLNLVILDFNQSVIKLYHFTKILFGFLLKRLFALERCLHRHL